MASKKKPKTPLTHRLFGATPAQKATHKQYAKDKRAEKRRADEHRQMLRNARRKGWGA